LASLQKKNKRARLAREGQIILKLDYIVEAEIETKNPNFYAGLSYTCEGLQQRPSLHHHRQSSPKPV